MPIVAKCRCGKRIGLADVMAGRTIQCPACGEDVLVTASPSTAGTATAKKKSAASTTPSISVSPAIIGAAVIGSILLVVVLTLYYGPWRVGTQWAAMSKRANDNVTDVVGFALKAYESENGMWNAAISHRDPQVEGEATFVPPMMAFSMPQRIIFTGNTNQGSYTGTYDTTNGEIVAKIEVGGATVAGLVQTRKATGVFAITGREKNGQVEAECDGKPLKIVIHKAGEMLDEMPATAH